MGYFGAIPMTIPPPSVLDPAEASLIDGVPDAPAVFLIHAQQGAPYLARTALLRRRLRRLLKPPASPSRFLRLGAVARRVEYWLTHSSLEALLLHYELARIHFPDQYASLLKLRPPVFVCLLMANRFPRTVVTTRLTGGPSVYFGPFRTRAAAEEFETRMLDLFQLRRCQEDLAPSPDHPGCIYGEMGMCLRPCQLIVGEEEYASEAARVASFLHTRGQSMLSLVRASRDRFSQELRFEDAAREHKRLEKVEAVLRLRDELAADLDRLYGVAITRSAQPSSVTLWFVTAGVFTGPRSFSYAAAGESVSLDRRLRELAAGVQPAQAVARRRAEHLALLSRWYYSSWRDGEWLSFDSLETIPYRRLVHAIHRMAAL
jgi:excinuclease ABC subunit C